MFLTCFYECNVDIERASIEQHRNGIETVEQSAILLSRISLTVLQQESLLRYVIFKETDVVLTY